ncbi:MAG: carboxypeptidase regulatory-like domain-containing protein, partial [Bacteroidales bacterium]|nr:carboxypeptidase regulatory-like domain-containing protein [Bacteroidales bacterium]
MKKITNYVLMITTFVLLSFVHLSASAQCTYNIKLYDTWGDGWNGGMVDVLVNGSVVVDNATLASGTGPATFNFTVNNGDMVTTDYTAGSWSSENYYQIYNATNVMVYSTPAGNTPWDLLPPGITAACPPPVGDVVGHVYNGDGVPIAGAEVGIEGGSFRITDAAGAYTFLGLPAGPNELYATKEGWNTIYETVTVISSNTVTLDFTLTKPSLTVNPLMFDEILNPNEYLTKFLGMLNIGDGPAGWTAEVVYPEAYVVNNINEVESMDFAQMSQSNNAFGDNSHLSFQMNEEDGTRGLLDCPEGSVFGNAPVGSNNGYTSDAGVGYFCYQQYSASGNFNTVTFWSVV